jgi:phospholipid/cholesterol/gamma-HCH transport system permease protein
MATRVAEAPSITDVVASAGALSVERTGPDSAVVSLSGAWLSVHGLPDPAVALRELEKGSAVRRLGFDASGLTAWDSGLLTFVLQVLGETGPRGIAVDRTGLPEGARRLLALAEAVPEQRMGREGIARAWPARLGAWALSAASESAAGVTFLGEFERCSPSPLCWRR